MKDKYKEINEVMDLLKDEFIEEAFEEGQSNKRRVSFWGYVVAAACICLVVSGVGWSVVHHRNLPDVSKNDTLDKYKIPEIKYEEGGNSYENLEKVLCDFHPAEGGGSGNHGWLIIKSLQDDLSSKNPTRNHVEEITELPVFKNEKGLWSDSGEWKNLDEIEIYFPQPCNEETRDYNYDGTCSGTWNVYFKSDTEENITDQLLEYTFYRIFYADYGEGGWYRVMTPPASVGKMYPILSLEQAEQKLRRGEFFSHTPNDKDVAGTAKILSVELEYLTEEYQTYIQPFYKFVITDESWDISQVMDCENWKDYMSVSEVYVPAVQDKYLEIKESADFRTN